MADVVVVGGGPVGPSMVLFTAKNGLEAAVSDADRAWMHEAHLFDHLGAAALSILSKETGEQFHDFDTPAGVPWLDRVE